MASGPLQNGLTSLVEGNLRSIRAQSVCKGRYLSLMGGPFGRQVVAWEGAVSEEFPNELGSLKLVFTGVFAISRLMFINWSGVGGRLAAWMHREKIAGKRMRVNLGLIIGRIEKANY